MPEQRTRRDGNTCRRKRPNYRNRAPIFPFAPRKPPAADRSYPPESAHHGRRWPTIRAPVDDLSRCGGPVHPFLASPRRRRLSREIGRASCRERVEVLVFGGSLKK